MNSNNRKSLFVKSGAAAAVLLLASGAALAQQVVNLTAGSTTAMLPDGSAVPMWGYSCGAGSTPGSCAALNPKASGWSPVVITVPTGQTLQINLTNNLSFSNGSGGTNTVPTSLVIVGQLGGGLGDLTQRTTTASPDHTSTQANVTWPIAGAAGTPGTPPPQGPRVQSFSTEVAGGATQTLCWGGLPGAGGCSGAAPALRPGTYLIESGTHPSIQGPMGLYGILVVTTAPGGGNRGMAYPSVNYDAEVPLLLSEIDPVQNTAVSAAVATVGFSESATLSANANQPLSQIVVTNAGKGYTATTTVTLTGGGGTGATAAATVDTDSTSPTFGQVTGINLTSPGSGYNSPPTVTINGAGTGAAASAYLALGQAIGNCSGGAPACYPPAVNYTPLYYLINGVAFDKNNSSASLFTPTPSGVTGGSLLVRLVNAGLRMHVPSIVGSLTGTPAVSGFGLIAEDGNPLPGVTRVQSEVFMAAGKTYDVMVNVPSGPDATTPPKALPIYDRELSLSANSVARDAGMLAYIGANSGVLPVGASALAGAKANPDAYSFVGTRTLTISDAGKGVLANDVNISGVQVQTPPACGLYDAKLNPQGLSLSSNGTFTYIPCAASAAGDSFGYCGNGASSGAACTTVTLNAAKANGAITLANNSFTSNLATSVSIKPPGLLMNATDSGGYPLSVVVPTTAVNLAGGPGAGTVTLDAGGGFTASANAAGTYTFTFTAQDSQGTTAQGTATVVFPTGSGLIVKVYDGTDKTTPITDYRWVIEEDRTFYIDPNNTTNTGSATIVPTFGTNFHTSYMPLIAAGCTGDLSCEKGQTMLGKPVVCDVGNGVCRPGTEQTAVDPSQVVLDPSKRYYISILPGDAGNDFSAGYLGAGCTKGIAGADSGFDTTQCGHGMSGAPIAAACTPAPGSTTCTGSFSAVTIWSQPAPYPPSKLSVFVFEDDFPLNGEQDAGGGIDVLAKNEPGLGQFNITLFDDAGGTGDATGQMTYDMFNQPLVNSLAGTIDPTTGQDACPISKNARPDPTVDPTATGITGTIVTCPRFEADGRTLSPLAGQAVIANLMPGRYGVVATPGADRIAAGEEWLQTNTLDGQKAHDSFLRIGEPAFFQEFGPAGYHVAIGFANPAIIKSRKDGVCNGTDPNLSATNCTNSIIGRVTTERMSRTPDERLYSSGSNDSFAFTQCYVSFGDTDGEDFAFTKCNADGTFEIDGLPDGTWRVTVFDQWNDMLVDGLSTPVALSGSKQVNMGDIAMNQWQANIYTRTFLDPQGAGVPAKDLTGIACTAPNTPVGCNANYGNDVSSGLTLVATNIRFRDGSYSNFNNTDLAGNAGFNEVFPLFSWYVVETDSTRYKNSGVHVAYDVGGAADGTTGGGSSRIGQNMANTAETISIPSTPTNLRVPGAVYCATADCDNQTLQNGPLAGGSSGPAVDFTDAANPIGAVSSGRIDPPWVTSEGWQGFSGQNSFIEFGKKPFAPGETGGIHGEVIYASTRPFDDPSLLIHTSWTPDVPGVGINLYQETTAADGTTALTLIDHTVTTSWDAWAQGFRSDGVPNMNCPGQGRDQGPIGDLFFFTLKNQPIYLDTYQSQHTGGTAAKTLPYNSQFKCFDGMHNWNQVQPAPYDGAYYFPSIASIDPASGRPGSNCTPAPVDVNGNPTGPGCVKNPDSGDKYWGGMPMLPPGKYVVEMVVPPGYELVKEEDKNILIGDNYIAPATVQFPNLATAVYIMPDQAEVSAYYNANNPQNPTVTLGRTTYPSQEGDTGSVETFWPCVGEMRQVPDYISLFPQSGEVAPFAGAMRPLCDRKEVTLTEQTSALAKFWIFTSAHVAAHFTGVITDDFTSEFDPFSPQFGEKFSPPNMPISLKDWTGTEISRVYTDQWGTYNGLTYSTWEVNPPNPTGYAPTMMVTCMNDPGTGAIPDALFNPEYSQFCYEIPFMPGQTQYMDTPVVPVSAFAGAGYNNPDCAYPALTPAIKEVDGAGLGPWVQAGSSPVASLNLTSQGSGYTGLPTVSISGGGGSGAAASANDLNIGTINLTLIGAGYNSATVTIDPPPAGGTQATATAQVSGLLHVITGITVTNQGSGYTSRPNVQISAPNRPGPGLHIPATARASMEVHTVNVTAGGTGYQFAPTVAFTGGGTNNEATATANLGPSTTVQSLTITALGDQQVPNNAYSGPAAMAAPFNAKNVTRHYGFGTQCPSPPTGGTLCNTVSSVTIGGIPAAITSWSDTSITVNVPNGVPPCTVQQQAIYQGTPAQCGQLVVTAGNGLQSIDTVTVTIGGKAPDHVGPTGKYKTIQAAIDGAQPGDLLMVDPGVYNEMLIMWKPVRLQGVGAASSVINANAHPAGKLDPWRARISCLFGLARNGQPLNPGGDITFADLSPTIKTNPFDTTGTYACPSTDTTWTDFTGGANNPQVDRIPLEGIVGWDTTLNGNLAQLLQEPTLMGAYEGAGITVVAKGVVYPGTVGSPLPTTNVFGTGQDTAAGANIAHEGQMPLGTLLLQSGNCLVNGSNPYPSNFLCNPARIDGLSITDSSQGGGGVNVHGWAHNLEIANNRVYNNTGTLTGGITIGQGESPDALLSGNGGDPIGLDQAPWTCLPGAQVGTTQNVSPQGTAANQQMPYCYNTNVSVHNNAITRNSSIGDELFSATPAGAGGVTFCVGSDYYKFNYNWLCGNLSTGDGGGLAHLGFSVNGDIEHNSIVFNQSTNPTIPTNGGGIVVMGAAPDGGLPGAPVGFECGSVTDVDCAPGLSDGTGPGLVINANLIEGNAAESGSGGGIRLQSVNGTEVGNFPTSSGQWYAVQVTNNIINNNVAGWDGAGVSLQDALVVNLINNTIMSNDTTASAGVLFNTLGAPLASAPGDTNQTNSTVTSTPQAAGVVTMRNSSLLTSSVTNSLSCPTGHGSVVNGRPTCRDFSVPLLLNDVIWENRSYYIGVGSLGQGTLNQQNVVSLFTSFTSSQAPSQSSTDGTQPNGNGVIITGGTGACTAASYWDIGVRGDRAPADHSSGLTLAPRYSVLTDAQDYPGNNNLGANPTVLSQYCNGSRSPPEFMSAGYQVPPGISDATVPNPIFNLTPSATVDEGNNWINISWGPLAQTGPVTNSLLGNYALASGSPAIDYIPLGIAVGGNGAPPTDFFGHPRPAAPNTRIDVGAVEFQGTGSGGNASDPYLTPDALNFGSVAQGANATLTVTLTNPPGHAALAGLVYTVSGSGFARPAAPNGGTCNAGGTLAAGGANGATCTVVVRFTAGTPGSYPGTLTVTGTGVNIAGSPVPLQATSGVAPILSSVTPNTGVRGTAVPVTLRGTNFSLLGSTVGVAGNGVSVSNVNVVQDPSTKEVYITGTFTVAGNATLGAHNVTVTTGGLTTNSLPFTVTAPPVPTVSGVSPTHHVRGGGPFTLTITGTGFSSGATVHMPLVGSNNDNNTGGITITGNSVNVMSSTTITVTISVSNLATLGARDVRVTTLGGESAKIVADRFSVP